MERNVTKCHLCCYKSSILGSSELHYVEYISISLPFYVPAAVLYVWCFQQVFTPTAKKVISHSFLKLLFAVNIFWSAIAIPDIEQKASAVERDQCRLVAHQMGIVVSSDRVGAFCKATFLSELLSKRFRSGQPSLSKEDSLFARPQKGYLSREGKQVIQGFTANKNRGVFHSTEGDLQSIWPGVSSSQQILQMSLLWSIFQVPHSYKGIMNFTNWRGITLNELWRIFLNHISWNEISNEESYEPASIILDIRHWICMCWSFLGAFLNVRVKRGWAQFEYNMRKTLHNLIKSIFLQDTKVILCIITAYTSTYELFIDLVRSWMWFINIEVGRHSSV